MFRWILTDLCISVIVFFLISLEDSLDPYKLKQIAAKKQIFAIF